jgi:hypothetical protein
MGTLIWNGVQTCPACTQCPTSDGADITSDVVDSTATVGTDRLVLGTEKICQFAEDFDSEGLVVPEGTKVVGPAVVKPDRNLDWGYPVYVDEKYETQASDEVIWLLNGDNTCVDAQEPFFTYWQTDNPTN